RLIGLLPLGEPLPDRRGVARHVARLPIAEGEEIGQVGEDLRSEGIDVFVGRIGSDVLEAEFRGAIEVRAEAIETDDAVAARRWQMVEKRQQLRRALV